ncbi:MAG: metallophosphoesterase family protein [Spirochaetales bacterium]|nr:metallophosphoesterase family protein [Spirochaetales bacterium]
MSSPVLVLADIHGNFHALKAVLSDALGDYESIWVLGDVVGYGPDPKKCLETLIRCGATMVAGNHDLAVCGQVGLDDFNSEARFVLEKHQKEFNANQKEFLSKLPWTRKERSVTLSHGNPLNPIWGYVLNESTAFQVLKQSETSLTLIGHSHIPGLWELNPDMGLQYRSIELNTPMDYSGHPHLANPGSVGQSRDGSHQAQYLIVQPERKILEFRRCSWKHRPVRRKMQRKGYPSTLIERMAPLSSSRFFHFS